MNRSENLLLPVAVVVLYRCGRNDRYYAFGYGKAMPGLINVPDDIHIRMVVYLSAVTIVMGI